MITSRRLLSRRIGGYQLPDLFESEDDWRRTYNLDITEMDSEDLRVELARVKRAYVVCHKKRLYVPTGEVCGSVCADDWLYFRAAAIDRELVARKKRRRS